MSDASVLVDEKISREDLKRFEKTYEEQLRRGQPSAQATFDYALCLVRGETADVRLGEHLLTSLLRREEEDIPKRDMIYYLAIAHTKLKNYDKAKEYVTLLLKSEPQNEQAQRLLKLIDDRMLKDGLIGAALIGGGIVAVGAVVIAGISALTRSSRR